MVYTVSQTDTKEDKGQTHLWMVKWDGSVHLQLTYGKEGAAVAEVQPRRPVHQLHVVAARAPPRAPRSGLMDRRGGEAEQFTAITDQDIEGYSWSPDSKKLLLTLHPKAEPDAEEGKPPVPPKPIVIDRYHFKQDIQGYLRDDDFDSLYLYDIATKKAEKLTTDKERQRRRRRLVAGRRMDRLRQQPGPRSRPHQQHRRFCRGAQGRLNCAQAHHLDRPRWRPSGLVARFQVHRLHPGRRA